MPAGLTATHSTTHFVLHYNPSVSQSSYVTAGAADFEEAYSRLVTGGGGSPNAGLRAPTPDGDGKTDVYLSAPSNMPTFVGGTVYDDLHGPKSSYMFLTPDQTRTGFRFRAAHEFMHVIQGAYSSCCGAGFYLEGAANWAADWSLPDSDPLNNRFGFPELPLSCSFGTWPPGGGGQSCGNGYGHWLFIQHAVEQYGAGFVKGVHERCGQAGTACGGVSADIQYTDAQLGAMSGGQDDVRRHFADYARDIWDPTRWRTTAVKKIHDLEGLPAHTLVTRNTPDTGNVGVTVDPLAARYVRILNDGGFDTSGPSDQLQVSITRPGGHAGHLDVLKRAVGTQSWTDVPAPSGLASAWDPRATREYVLPLINDRLTGANLAFAYRVQYTRGPTGGTPNHTPTAPASVGLGQQIVNDYFAYAGGDGTSEAPGCPFAQGAQHGMWWAFTTPYTGGTSQGLYTYDATQSDFPAVIVLYDATTGAFAGCSANGKFGSTQPQENRYLVYIGRRPGNLGTGTVTKLTVTGPPGLPQCSDGRDNDGDARIDYPADPDCVRLVDNAERTLPQCSDGEDNDGDGRIDARRPGVGDPGCEDRTDNDETDTQCVDGQDNDGDGDADRDDYGCDGPNDTDEGDDPRERPRPQCSDGIDNDGDGRTDYRPRFFLFTGDPDCWGVGDNTEQRPSVRRRPGE